MLHGPAPLASTRRESAVLGAVQALVPAPPVEPVSQDAVVTAVRRLPRVEGQYGPYPERLDPRLRAILASRGVERFYTHQTQAIDHALAGRSVVVVTPAASGKTLCYNGPVLNAVLADPSARALYLFPTKALAQDQLAELHELAEELSAREGRDLGVFTYDGDTPQDARRSIRSRANVVLTNPDMLHAGILPHHPRWAKLFENLRYVVIDELHTYRGVFGSHLANVLRRLRRICRFYGADPTFICCSATIANPRELAERLVERSFELVDESGAPRGEKYFVFLNPPVVNRQLGIRRSYLAETRRVALDFLDKRLQVIVFAQTRLATEILTTYLKNAMAGGPVGPEAVRGYRGGYLPLRRREIEKGLRDGVVRAVVSTNALELGVDIGALDVCVMAGYPGTIAATWQRAGRAGRRQSASAALLVASSAPLDQFVVRHPSYFFDASPERGLINPDNLHVLVDHLKCAAFELPFTTDEPFGGVQAQDILGVLAEEGFVHLVEEAPGRGQWHWTHETYPADAVSLRSVTSDNFVVVDTTDGEARVIGETDFTSGPSTLHEKAIYLLEGAVYQVERLDYEERKAFVRAVECDYYTNAITYTKVTPIDAFDSSSLAAPDGRGGVRTHGEVHVSSRVVGFKKIKFYTNENVGAGDLTLPEQQMHTTAYWLSIPAEVMEALPYGRDERRDGVSGMAFAMRHIAQLMLMCEPKDIGVSVTSADGAPVAGPDVFIYDNYPGGVGFSEPLYRMHDELLERTRELLSGCPCDHGCPSCVGPIGESGPLAKAVAADLAALLIDGAIVSGRPRVS
jgi:DEAD/DEAH box helicase domain-containing protein